MSKLPVSSYPSSKWTIQCSINKFSFKLFKNLSTKLNVEMSNLCFSPLEVFNSLVMLLLGANGVSEKELEEVLCLKDFNNLEKYEELMDLCEWIIKSNHDIMLYGTCVYIDYRLQVQNDYIERLKNVFEIKPKRVDFSKLNFVTQIINRDAHCMTDGVLSNVISIDDINSDPNAKLIISNSVFFRGYWLMKFGDIHKEPFTYDNGQKKLPIDMMSHVGYHRYLFDECLKAQAVSIAYAVSDIRMIIVLPEDITSDGKYLIELLDEEKLTELFGKLQKSAKSLTELTIPRFALEANKVSLHNTIKRMGANSIYDNKSAELTGICANDRIHLTRIVHKAFILVDERGSHTSSKYSEAIFMKSFEEKISDNDIPVVFKANHPFVFIILDKITGVICFMGVLADPTQILEVVNENDLSHEEIHQLLADNDNDLNNCSDSSLSSLTLSN